MRLCIFICFGFFLACSPNKRVEQKREQRRQAMEEQVAQMLQEQNNRNLSGYSQRIQQMGDEEQKGWESKAQTLHQITLRLVANPKDEKAHRNWQKWIKQNTPTLLDKMADTLQFSEITNPRLRFLKAENLFFRRIGVNEDRSFNYCGFTLPTEVLPISLKTHENEMFESLFWVSHYYHNTKEHRIDSLWVNGVYQPKRAFTLPNLKAGKHTLHLKVCAGLQGKPIHFTAEGTHIVEVLPR